MPEGPGQFIGRPITVARDETMGQPISFCWDEREYTVCQVIAAWQDWGFSAGSPKRKNWRMRRHRNWYRVETADGAVFELYHDRGLSLTGGEWILHSRLD